MSSTAGQAVVLFFGKHDCRYSEQAVEHLRLLGFEVCAVFSRTRHEPLPPAVLAWTGDYILSFRSYFILPPGLLGRARTAINFHPGPPEYPGSAPASWALYENATVFGATAHLMTERVDAGRIIECRRFRILPRDDVGTLASRAYLKCFDLFLEVTTGLALAGEGYLTERLEQAALERWSGRCRTIRELDALQVVSPDCSPEELDRIVRATALAPFFPEVHVHGRRFVLKP